MRDTRWIKLARDLRADRARVIIMIIGLAAGVFGVGTVLGARAILTREIARNYLGTNPPTVVYELAGAPPDLVDQVRRQPGVAAATGRATIRARVASAPEGADDALAAMAAMHARAGLDAPPPSGERAWRPLVLFVAPADRMPEVGRVTTLDRAWPPPVGTVFVERAAAALLGARTGDALRVRLPGATARAVAISGLVHDPALAPSAMERTAWAYATPATIAALGGAATLDELWVTFAPAPLDQADADARARELGAWLGTRGATVHAIRVPPPGRHPHESQMQAILLMLLVFSALALVLGGVLAATLVAALLARQVRELGVMKALGARAGQVAAIYVVLLLGIGAIAIAIAGPGSVLAARGFASTIAALLNFDLASRAIPLEILAIPIAAGLLVPLVLGAIPIAGAARTTVRAALDAHGAGPVAPGRLARALVRIPLGGTLGRMAVRNTFRRRARLIMTLAMLALGGALFLTALDLATAWTREVDEVTSTRSYAVELRLAEPATRAAIAARLAGIPGVGAIEAWGTSPAALRHAGQLDVVRTYPDGGHGSLRILGAPTPTAMVDFPLLAGRWLTADDSDGVVINHMLAAQAPDLAIGGTLALSLEGRLTTWRVVGVVRDVGSAATVYARDAALADALGTPGQARLIRIATTSADPGPTIAAIERALADAGIEVDVAIPLAELRTAMGDHMGVLISTLLAMAALMGLVGVLGLASAMSTSVLERTRELGVMRALGATPWALARLVGGEAIVVAALSWLVAIGLSVPLAAIVGRVVGALAFRTPLPLVLRLDAMAAWLAIALGVAILAAIAPARRAGRRSIRDALGAP
jgi:putative ABC transport system permease protein